MNHGWSLETLLRDARDVAQDLIGNVIDAVTDDAGSLRDGSTMRSIFRAILRRIATRKPSGGITPDTLKRPPAVNSVLSSYFSNAVRISIPFRSFRSGCLAILTISRILQ